MNKITYEHAGSNLLGSAHELSQLVHTQLILF